MQPMINEPLPAHRNLYEQVFVLHLYNQTHEAETLLLELMHKEPENAEAVYVWTDLCCKLGKQAEAKPRVSKLLHESPANPYYILANLFIEMTEVVDSPEAQEIFPVHETLEHAISHAEDSFDQLAKIALFTIITGFWSEGMNIFLSALFLKQDHPHYLHVDELLTEWIEDIEVLDGVDDLNPAPVTLIAKVACLLIAFDRYIPEARLALYYLLQQHKKLGKAAHDGKLANVLQHRCPEARYVTDALKGSAAPINYTSKNHHFH